MCASRLGWVAGDAQVIHRVIHIFARTRALDRLAEQLELLRSDVEALKIHTLERTNTVLLARLDELETQFQKAQLAHRSEMGKLWRSLRGGASVNSNVEVMADDETAREIEDWLKLQREH